MPENYPSASEIVRNIAQIHLKHEVLETQSKFRIVQFTAPYWNGYEFWVINEKGFLWEPADSLEAAREYLLSDEALRYNGSP